jgi:hypothetical protein
MGRVFPCGAEHVVAAATIQKRATAQPAVMRFSMISMIQRLPFVVFRTFCHHISLSTIGMVAGWDAQQF